MRTLIVPCLGRKMVNGTPQYLMKHPNGEMLLKYSIEGVYTAEYDKIVIALLEEDVEKYNAREIINAQIRQYPIEIVMFEQMTSGPAETVYQTIKRKGIKGSIVVKDADNFLRVAELPQGNFVAGLDLNSWDKDVHNLRNKSFLIVNEQGNILDIIEKKICSDVVCLGLYGFKRAEDFLWTFERLNDASYPICSLYLSHLISYLIGYSRRVFRYVECQEYENWGDERLWRDMQRDYALYFVDLDYLLGTEGVLDEEYSSKLQTLQKRGATFVGYTVRGSEFESMATKILIEKKLKFIKVVCECPYSQKKAIIDSDAVLGKKVLEL